MFTQDKYQKALNFATKAHKDQKTKFDTPYITYLASIVMEIIHACNKVELDLKKTDLAISVAFLHEVLNKTEVTYDEIYKEFGASIAEAVDAFSVQSNEPQKQQVASCINNILTQSYEIQIIKLASAIVSLQKPPASWESLDVLNQQKEAKFILSCLKNSNIYLSKRLEDKINQYIVFINR